MSERRIAPITAGAVAVVLAVLVVILFVNRGESGDSAATPLLGNPAPAARGELDDGTPFDLSRRKGSWVVLNFFTDDCVPCIVEHPELIEFVDQQRQLGTAGAEFYTIVQNSTPAEVDTFFAERGGAGQWPVVFDNDNEFSIEFGVFQVPETWIIDPAGFVRSRIIVPVTADALSATLAQMQGGAA